MSRHSLIVSTRARPCLVDKDGEGVTVGRDGRSCERMLLSVPLPELADLDDDEVVTLRQVRLEPAVLLPLCETLLAEDAGVIEFAVSGVVTLGTV